MKWIYAPLLLYSNPLNLAKLRSARRDYYTDWVPSSMPQKVVTSKLFHNQVGGRGVLITQPDVSAFCLGTWYFVSALHQFRDV
jgi:hypothetical protein